MDQLGGYRIVRKLGDGPRAELLLGRTDGESESEASVALKHYRDGVDDASIATEIEALARAAGDHAVELLDVATAPSGSLALVLDRLPGGSLGRLLAQRPTLELGELPTIMAPLASLVDRLHSAGVVHRGIRLESVIFDRAGAPMLACFGRAELIDPGLPPAALEAIPGVHADQRALASIAAAVIDRADDRHAVRELTDWLATGVDEFRVGWGAELAALLMELAPAIPVDFSAPVPPAEVRIPARIPLDAPPPRKGRKPVDSPGRRRRHDGTGRSRGRDSHPAPRDMPRAIEPVVDEPWHRGIPPNAESWSVGALVDDTPRDEAWRTSAEPVPEPWRQPAPLAPEPWRAPSPSGRPAGSRSAAKPALDAAGAPDWMTALIPGDAVARVRASLGAVRAPVWIVAALVGVSLVAAIIFVPQGDSGARADADPNPTPSATEPGHGWTPTGAAAEPSDPIQGDDPIAAVVALLEARDGCVADRSVLCLDAVGQVGSSALDDDQRLIRSLQDGAESPPPFVVDADQVTLAERLGDTALVNLADVAETQPASILLMRTEAGWRIRDYMEP